MGEARRFLPRARLRAVLIALPTATAVGLLLFGYRYLEVVASRDSRPWLDPFISEISSVYLALLFLPVVVGLARRYRLDRAGWLQALPVHLFAAVVVSVVGTTGRWAVRSALFPLAGLGPYDYGVMPVRYLMELPMDLLVFAMFVGFTYLFDHVRAVRERDVRLAQLETELVRAQLDALRAQLDPHFLFNALNAVSSVMYDDVERADAVLGRLAELLRRTLRTPTQQGTSLADELEVVELYLDIMRARFGDRLEAELHADSTVLPARVPALLLQPLVENAVRHGAPPDGSPVRVTVTARRAGDRLVVEVVDAGGGIEGDWRDRVGQGIGLGHTVARLERLYGEDHALELRNARGGGLIVHIEIPYEPTVPEPTADTVEAAWSA
jgi:signal transduction histidine kinase